MSSLASFRPTAPVAIIDRSHHEPFLSHIKALETQLAAHKLERDAAFTAARAAQNAALLSLHRRHAGDAIGAAAALREATDVLPIALQHRRGDGEDDYGLSAAAQQVCAAQCFNAFLATGTLGTRPVASSAWVPEPSAPKRTVGGKAPRDAQAGDDTEAAAYTDEEWLGAMISATHEIGRYASAAATCGDTRSVGAASAVTHALHDALAAFDLRNGNLRRSFDSLKYVVRKLEDTTYELSLFPPATTPLAGSTSSDAASTAATALPEEEALPAAFVDEDALETARAAYAEYDLAREGVIKACREPQKQAKQAIAALHRGEAAKAAQSLQAARDGALRVLDKEVAAHPALRGQGAVRAMLEELAEAALFEAWLQGADEAATTAGPRTLLLPDSAALLGGHLQTAEYIGGLCDLVGEVGRYAVRKATERDKAAVREALAVAVAVQSALLALGSSAPRGTHKKGDALRTAVRKMETLLYELSLVERSGRVREAPPEGPADPALGTERDGGDD